MNRDKQKLFYTLVVLITISFNPSLSQDVIINRLVDSKSKSGIPFAYIKVIGKNNLELSDENGYFKIRAQIDDSLKISHVAYTTLSTTIEKIKAQKSIEMKEISIEINPIVITSNSAKILVDRAIDSTYSTLKEPMYFTCFRFDQVLFRDTLIASAKAEISYICDFFLSTSHGGDTKGYLKNIIVERDTNFKELQIPRFDIPASFSPINRFILGVSKVIEKNVYFSKQEINDSIFIIGINPRMSFKPKNYVLKYGRFIINKSTWKILQIDTYLSPEMMEISRDEDFRPKRAKHYIYHYSYSHFYDKFGNLSRVISDYTFSYPHNNPNDLWQNHSEFVFINEIAMPEIDKTTLLKRDTTLVKMNSKKSTGFEKQFDKWINSNGNTYSNIHK